MNQDLKNNIENIHSKYILKCYNDTYEAIHRGKGPFGALIVDALGNIVCENFNSVEEENKCTRHAEINTIELAHIAFGTYDLSSFNLSIYINAEPCMMCAGALMWSGIKNIYYGVSSNDVESILGFDEGPKIGWIEEFKNRGINVIGNIEKEKGISLLNFYKNEGKTIYKPER